MPTNKRAMTRRCFVSTSTLAALTAPTVIARAMEFKAVKSNSVKIDRIDLFPVRYPVVGYFKFFEGPGGSYGRAAVFVKMTADDGKETTRPMLASARGESFTASLSAVTGPLQYRLQIGDSQSDIYHVEIVKKPTVEDVEATYEYPAYLDKPNATIRQPHVANRITSELHANILDRFNEAGVEIMSPAFTGSPVSLKPSFIEMRPTWVSTTTPSGLLYISPRTTLAVLRPAPGTLTRAFMSLGTSPSWRSSRALAAPCSDLALLR